VRARREGISCRGAQEPRRRAARWQGRGRAPSWRALAVVLSVLLPVAASAQTDADRYFEEGVREVEEGEYEAALRAFRASYQAEPSVDALYNIGMCQRVLEDDVGAIGSFRRYLEGAGASISAEEREALRSLVGNMLEDVGEIVVEVGVPGASVLVDGVEVGSAPLPESILVVPGEHEVAARSEGYQGAAQSRAVGAGQTWRVLLVLVPLPAPGTLAIRCETWCPDVTLGGEWLGVAPIERALAPGTYHGTVSGGDLGPYDIVVEMESGRQTVVYVDAVRQRATVEETGPVTDQGAGVGDTVAETSGPDVAIGGVADEQEDAGLGLGPWFWAGVGLAGAATVAAAVTGGLTLDYRERFIDSGNVDAHLRDTGIALRTATDVLIGLAVLGAWTGLVALFMSDDGESGGSDPTVPVLALPAVVTW
jgi:hypothetical protein